MVGSVTPKSVVSTGNIRAWWVPGTTSTPASVATLVANTTKDVTFSLTGGGFTPAISENSVADSRLGQRQILNKRGNFSETVEIEYVYGDAADVAQPIFTEGTSGYLVVRTGVANELDPTVAQKVFVYSADLGKQQFQPPAENALLSIKQSLYLNAPTQYLVALAA